MNANQDDRTIVLSDGSPFSESELIAELAWSIEDRFPRCPACHGSGWLLNNHQRQPCTKGVLRIVYGQLACLDPNYERLTKDGLPVETHRACPGGLSEDGHQNDRIRQASPGQDADSEFVDP